MDFAYHVPAAMLLLAVVAVSVVLVAGGQLFVHRHFKGSDFVAHNEVGGIIMAVSGSIYAVILGFLTVVAWGHFQEARELVVLESDADIDAWHTAVGLPDAVRARVRHDVLGYAELMKTNEWPLMKQGRFDADAAMVGMDAIDAAGSDVPANPGEANAQNATLQQLTIMHDARPRRVAMNDSGITWFEWLVLFIGALCVICFSWLFGLKNRRTHVLMTSIVVTMIASILVLLFELQYPFRSNVGIGPEAWVNAVAHLHQMQTGSMAGMRM